MKGKGQIVLMKDYFIILVVHFVTDML